MQWSCLTGQSDFNTWVQLQFYEFICVLAWPHLIRFCMVVCTLQLVSADWCQGVRLGGYGSLTEMDMDCACHWIDLVHTWLSSWPMIIIHVHMCASHPILHTCSKPFVFREIQFKQLMVSQPGSISENLAALLSIAWTHFVSVVESVYTSTER